jgi:acyl dehydratase
VATQPKTAYEGKWRRLVNLSADRKGSIHDDEAARSLGFRGGFVPGSIVATAALPALVHAFGPRWMEGGWYRFNFVSPVYIDEEVREVGVLEGATLNLRVENREGRLCCSGQAGLGVDLPWDVGMDGKRGAGEVLPNVEVGLSFDEAEFVTSAADVAGMLRAAGDETPWYEGASPWGGAIVPPERLHHVALQATRSRRLEVDGVRPPGMWAEHALALKRPLFQDRSYFMRERIVDKGRSGRALFLTYEFDVVDSAGELLATGRHKLKWLAAD